MAVIRLGQEVEDRVSGFKGIAVSVTRYLQGCNRVFVQPKVGEDEKMPEGEAFDEPDLKVIGVGVYQPKKTKKPNGGIRPVNTKPDYPAKR